MSKPIRGLLDGERRFAHAGSLFMALVVLTGLGCGKQTTLVVQSTHQNQTSSTAVDLAAQINARNATGYADVFRRVINPKCVGCHQPTMGFANIRYDTYQLTVAPGFPYVKSVIPGNAMASSMCKVLIDGTIDTVPGVPSLSDADRLAICNWIQAGTPF